MRRFSPIAWITACAWLAAAGLIGLAYRPTFHWMTQRWDGPDSYYGHGWIIPPLCAWLLWRIRKDLVPELDRRDPWALWGGAILAGCALGLLLIGHMLTVFFVQGASFAILLCALGILLLNRRGMLRARFTFAFLFFMIPLPHEFLETLAEPLKKLVAASSLMLADLTGIPAILRGYEIVLPVGPVLIGSPCSGLRSIVAMAAMGAVVAHLSPLKYRWRAAIFAMAFPIAVITNCLRVFFLVAVANAKGVESVAPGAPAHDWSGYAVFALALLIFFSAARSLEVWRNKHDRI